MSIKVYRDNAANSIFIEDANGAQFLNSLQAVVESGLVSIEDLAKGYQIVSGVNHTDFVDENDQVYSGTATQVCDALNAIFSASGGSQGNAPVITSNTTINLVGGQTLNYELTATDGVGYEWDSLPSGVVTVEGNVRKLVGGSSLAAGTYNVTAKAINYYGFDSATISIIVSSPPYANTKSVNFNNNDNLIASSPSNLDSVLGRTSNGSGSSDAWTISTFFRPGTANNASQTILYFGAQDVANNGQIQIKYNGSLDRLELRYGSNNNRLNLVTSNNTLTTGQWHHIIVCYYGGTTGAASGSVSSYYGRFAIYIDGVLQSTTNSNSNFGYTGSIAGQNFKVGRWNNGQNLRNNCGVDELALWNSDQTSNVSDIYNSGTPHDLSDLTTPPSHWWRMGDGDTFPTLSDSGSVGNTDLTMTNMTVADIVSNVP